MSGEKLQYSGLTGPSGQFGAETWLRRRLRSLGRRIETPRVSQQLAAWAGEHRQSAIEEDRLGGEFERKARVLLDKEQRQAVLAFQAVEPREQ